MKKIRIRYFALFRATALLAILVPWLTHGAASGSLTRLEQLDSAATVLLASVDHSGTQCGITSEEAKVLLPVLQAQIDPLLEKEALHRLNRSRAQGKTVSAPTWPNRCSTGCHCGLYARILEEAASLTGEKNLGSKDQDTLDRLQKAAASISDDHIRKCASAAKWFCKSSLLRSLRKAASEFQPAESTY